MSERAKGKEMKKGLQLAHVSYRRILILSRRIFGRLAFVERERKRDTHHPPINTTFFFLSIGNYVSQLEMSFEITPASTSVNLS